MSRTATAAEPRAFGTLAFASAARRWDCHATSHFHSRRPPSGRPRRRGSGHAARGRHGGLQSLIEHLAGGGALPAAAGSALPLAQVQLDAPLPRPRRSVFCIGLNYRSHAAELAARGCNGAKTADDLIPKAVVAFSKVPESVILADAAYAVLNWDARTTTGNFFIDEEVLAKAGVTDLAKYSVVPGSTQLMPDLFL